MQSKNFFKTPFTWMMIIFSCLFLGTLIFTFFNDRFYNMPIGQITITYTISMNWSLEVARALTGEIGIVLTIPITIALMELWFKLRGVNRSEERRVGKEC